jgi:spore coat polysaccharide biosynthesis protein SpsF
MKIIAVVQARMESTRLPGKVLMDIEGKTMLSRVIERVRQAKKVDDVVVATTDRSADTVVVEACHQLGVVVFRGDMEDVLDRYYRAVKQHQAQVVVRITADCPLIDPDIIDQIITVFLENRVDYASNTMTRSYPRGLDVEVFSTAALERAWREADQQHQREHVTPYFYQNPKQFKLKAVTYAEDFSHFRWTVDTEEDLALIQAIYRRLPAAHLATWQEIVAFIYRESDLLTINNHIQQKSLPEVNG